MLVDGDLSRGAFRVWSVVVSEVASWSRLSDTVSRSDLADAARRDPKVVSAALAEMHSALVLTWEPGRRNVASRVTLHPTFEHLQRYRTRRQNGESPQSILAALRREHSEDPGVNAGPVEPDDSAGSFDDHSGEVSGSQRGPRGHHLYEENEENEERDQWVAFLKDTPTNREEWPGVRAALDLAHGTDRVAEALDSIGDPLPYSSTVRKAVQRWMTTNPRRTVWQVDCDRCDGHGWIFDEGGNEARQCDHSTSDTERRAS